MKIETWNTAAAGAKPNWHIHFEGGGNITFDAGGYNSKGIAVNAVCNHAIALRAAGDGIPVATVPADVKARIRKNLRAKVVMREAGT